MITAYIGSCSLIFLGTLFVLLAFGLPLGELTMGGRYRVMPNRMRVALIVALPLLAFAVFLLLHLGGVLDLGIPPVRAKCLAYAIGIYLGMYTAVTLTSNSKQERRVMTPLFSIAALCFVLTSYLSG